MTQFKIEAIEAIRQALGTPEANDMIAEVLRNGVHVVEFTKDNGDNRVMHCTLNESIIPKDVLPKGIRKPTSDVLRVWDVECEDWRSFRIDSVTAIKIGNGKV